MANLLNKNAPVTLIISGAAIVGCLIFFINRFTTPEGATPPRKAGVPQTWYYDRNTEELFTMPATTSGLVETDSGPFEGEPAGVRAAVFACGDCSTNEQYIGWLEKPSAKELEAIAGTAEISDDDLVSLVAKPGSNQWVSATSAQGEKIAKEARSRCPKGVRANFCQPKSK